MRAFSDDLVPSRLADASRLPVLRVADNAIGLWQAAEELGDPDLLESLRPLLMQIGRILARDIVDGDAGGSQN